jgi:hypothetical protein
VAASRRSVPHGHLWRLLELSPLAYFPDFLTPPGGDQSLEEKLELVRSTPRPELAAHIRDLAAPGPLRSGVRLTRWLRAVERGEDLLGQPRVGWGSIVG